MLTSGIAESGIKIMIIMLILVIYIFSMSLQTPISQLFFYAGFNLKQILSTWWETYSLHTQKKNGLTLLSLYVQPWTKHPVRGNGKPWRPCIGEAGGHVTDSPSRIGWGWGNSLQKRMLGRQKEVVWLKILLFCR